MDRIDLILMLKACPVIIAANLEAVKKFRFQTLQSAIIAAQNEDKVIAFEFYDKKNSDRTQQVSELIMNQKENLENVWDIMTTVKDQVQTNSDKLGEFLKMHEQREAEQAQYNREKQIQEQKEMEAELEQEREKQAKLARKAKSGKKPGASGAKPTLTNNYTKE